MSRRAPEPGPSPQPRAGSEAAGELVRTPAAEDTGATLAAACGYGLLAGALAVSITAATFILTVAITLEASSVESIR